MRLVPDPEAVGIVAVVTQRPLALVCAACAQERAGACCILCFMVAEVRECMLLKESMPLENRSTAISSEAGGADVKQSSSKFDAGHLIPEVLALLIHHPPNDSLQTAKRHSP